MSPKRDAYAEAGVDLDVNGRVKAGLAAAVASTQTDLVAAGFGSFGGAFSLPPGYREPVLVSSVDGVGTKLHLAIEWGRPGSAGRDVVNHGINDVGVLNARPLAFLDYIASSELDADTVLALVEGMAAACRAGDVALIGGETAQMPDTYRAGAYDVAGTMIGVCEALVYANNSGLDCEKLIAAVSQGAAGCWALDNLAPRIITRDFAPGFMVDHFIKDLGIAVRETELMAIKLPGLELAKSLYEKVSNMGHGRSGTQALLLALQDMDRGE